MSNLSENTATSTVNSKELDNPAIGPPDYNTSMNPNDPSSINIDLSQVPARPASASAIDGPSSTIGNGDQCQDNDNIINGNQLLLRVDDEGKYSRSRGTSPSSTDIFRNLRNAIRFSIDIGGSLTKIAYYSKVSHRRVKIAATTTTETTLATTATDQDQQQERNNPASETTEEFTYEVCERARLHFIKFETNFIEECLDFVQKRLLGREECMRGKCVKVTGGGAYKYSKLMQDKLGITPEKEDEVRCLIKGM